MAELWKGAPAAAALTEKLAVQAAALRQAGVVPTLAIVRVGERPEDLSYERGAVKRCEKVGIAVKRFILSEDASQEELTALLRQINGAPDIHGCLLFRPLPRHMDEGAVCAALSGQGCGRHHTRLSGVGVLRRPAGLSPLHRPGLHGAAGLLWI